MKLKKILAVVLAMALLCMTFAACGDSSGSSSSSAASTGSESSATSEAGESSTADEGGSAAAGDVTLFTPKTVDASKNLNIRIGMEPTGLNSLLSTYANEFTILRHIYENLYVLDENNVPQLGAAESVDISDDETVYTFHLREDGVWTNGDPVTANDFAFAWQQALSLDVASDYAYMLYFIKNAEAYMNYQAYDADPDSWEGEVPEETTWEDVGVKVIDDYTLEVTLERAIAYAPHMFTFGTLAPINQSFYETVGADNYNTEAEYFCTNGPFALTEWSHNSQIVLQKNDAFHGAGDIQVEQLTMKIITDGQAALTSLMSGELDYTDLTTGELVTQAEANGYEVTSYSDGASFYMMVNCENQFLSNVNLRRALALGFDKQALIDTVFQNENMPMTSFTAPAVNGYDGTSFQEALNAKDGDLYPANGDVAQAQEYLNTALEELGITLDELNGQLSIDCGDSSSSQAEAAFYQEQWRQNLGLEVTINPMITKQGADNRQNGNYCLSITGWSPDYNDPMTFLDMWVSDGGNNDTRWASEEYDALIDAATNETADMAARQEYFYQAEEMLADQYIILPSYWRSASYTYNTNKILGGLRNTTFQTNFAYVELAA